MLATFLANFHKKRFFVKKGAFCQKLSNNSLVILLPVLDILPSGQFVLFQYQVCFSWQHYIEFLWPHRFGL